MVSRYCSEFGVTQRRKGSKNSAALNLCHKSVILTFDETAVFPMTESITKKRENLGNTQKIRLCRSHWEICFVSLVGRSFPSLNFSILCINCLIRQGTLSQILFKHCLDCYLWVIEQLPTLYGWIRFYIKIPWFKTWCFILQALII